jgi:hypothetical protein
VLSAAALALLAGYGLTAWRSPRLVALSVALLAVLVADAPHTVRSLRATTASAEDTRLVRDDLRALISAGADGCGPIVVPGYRPVPLVRLLTGAPVSAAPAGDAPARVIVPTSAAAAASVTLAGAEDERIRALTPPAGFAAVAASRSWALLERCGVEISR